MSAFDPYWTLAGVISSTEIVRSLGCGMFCNGVWEARVFIRKLKPGERAPVNVDRITINRLADGQMSWTGSVEARGRPLSGASPASFETIQEAETDAIAWARARGTTSLQIEGPHGTLSYRLPSTPGRRSSWRR
jgi:hypothetical protein